MRALTTLTGGLLLMAASSPSTAAPGQLQPLGPAPISAPAPPPAACASVGPPSATLTGAETFVYRELGARTLRIHLFRPSGAAHDRPAVLMFFGGGFVGGDALSLARHAQRFVEQGYVAAIADYRVYCRDRTAPDAGVDDASAAYRWLRARAPDFGIERRRIVLLGGSAGGLLAVDAALRQPAGARPAALVLFNPVVDITGGVLARGLPNPTPVGASLSEPARRALSPVTVPLKGLPPTIVFHGTLDAIVPIATVETFCARAQAAGRECRLERYPGVGHSFYQRRDVVAPLGFAPFDETMGKVFAFLAGPGVERSIARERPNAAIPLP